MVTPVPLFGNVFISTISGAVVGAIVAGVISYLIQTKALKEARKDREEEQLRAKQALGIALLFKIIRIHSNLKALHDHFERCIELAKKQGSEKEPWTTFLPLANTPMAIHFSADEMGTLLSLEEDNVFNAIMNMDAVHNALAEGMNAANERIKLLRERLPVADVKGKVVGTEMDREQGLALRPLMIEVNDLFEQLYAQSERDEKEASDAMFKLEDTLRRKLDIKFKIELIQESERPAA